MGVRLSCYWELKTVLRGSKTVLLRGVKTVLLRGVKIVLSSWGELRLPCWGELRLPCWGESGCLVEGIQAALLRGVRLPCWGESGCLIEGSQAVRNVYTPRSWTRRVCSLYARISNKRHAVLWEMLGYCIYLILSFDSRMNSREIVSFRKIMISLWNNDFPLK